MSKILVKAAIPHWSKFFDTKEEMQQALQSLRFHPERDATLEGVEQVPLSPDSVTFELRATSPKFQDGKLIPLRGAKSLIPGIRSGRVVDRSLVDEGGAFVYPQQITNLGDLPRRDTIEPKKDILIGTTEKPKYHAGKLQGRVNPEGFMPGGFDPSQVFTIDQSPLSRYEARAQLLGGLGYLNRVAPEYHNEPAGIATRALLTAGIQPDSTANPLTAWGEPYTVDDEYFANKRKQNENAGRVITGEPMEIAMRLLKMNDPHEDDYAIEDDLYGDSNQTFDNRYIYELMRQIRDDGKTHNNILSEMSSGQKGADTRKRNKMLNQNRLAEIEQRQQERYRRGEIPYPIYRSEPMDIVWRMLKEELNRVASSPTLMRQRRVVADQNPANLPCPRCGNKILQEPCPRCGRPASLGAGTLKYDISKKESKPFHGYNPNSKKAKRRKSFCARMAGVKGPTSKKVN